MKHPVVAVIGAGIIGTLIAREIVRREPGADVMVFDRGLVGSGATLRSAGLHFPRGASLRVREMSAYSEDFYADLRRADPELPVRALGMTVVTREGSTCDPLRTYLKRANLAPAASSGHPDVLLTGLTAWSGSGCQYADVYGVAQRVARGLRPRVQFREGTSVTGLAGAGAQVRLRLGTGIEVTADHAVLAPGPWTGAAPWRELTSPLGIRVKRIVAMHIDQAPCPGDPCVVFEDDDAFLLPVVHRGHWLFSYTCQEWDVDPDAVTVGLTAAHLAQAREMLHGYAPRLADRCVSGRVFCDAYSPDREPIVRTIDEAARIVFAGAANGSGYRLAPAIAAAAADLLNL